MFQQYKGIAIDLPKSEIDAVESWVDGANIFERPITQQTEWLNVLECMNETLEDKTLQIQNTPVEAKILLAAAMSERRKQFITISLRPESRPAKDVLDDLIQNDYREIVRLAVVWLKTTIDIPLSTQE